MDMTPGSPAAVAQGCTCPVLDNAHGKGYMGGAKDKDGQTLYVIRAGCPLHDSGKDGRMNDNTVRLHVFIHAYVDDEGFGCFSWEQRAYTTEYVRLDVHQAELAAVRKEYTEELPALLALVGCATVDELAGRYRELCVKIVFGQIDGATIDKAEEVLQKWNGDT